MTDIDSVFGDEVYPLYIFDSGYHFHALSVAGTARLYVGFCADGCASELRVLPFYVVHTFGSEGSVFVGELESVAFVEQMQHGYFYFHII